MILVVRGGITAPQGFLAATVNCGIKRSGYDDLALLVSERPCVCAGVFTKNKMRSGSVELCERRLKKGLAQAVIVNSGNANCCVGKREIRDAEAITALTAGKIGVGKEEVLMVSTGIIGRPLPLDRIKKKIVSLTGTLSRKNALRFAKAIMTTDTVQKEIAVRFKAAGQEVTLGGSAKGSGMICPDMATMLAFFTTDAAIEKGALRAAFKESIDSSFNRITVDGDMSTNDSAIIFANGLAGNKIIRRGSSGYYRFLDALRFVTKALARKIVLDGEGATRFIEIVVKGAKSQSDAEGIARHVADSNLVKTMIAGGDPNWGRVASSIGSSGIDIKKDRVSIYFGNEPVMRNGSGVKVSRKKLVGMFKKKEIIINIDLRTGGSSSRIWTCDLTEGYVRINAEYEA